MRFLKKNQENNKNLGASSDLLPKVICAYANKCKRKCRHIKPHNFEVVFCNNGCEVFCNNGCEVFGNNLCVVVKKRG